MPTEPTDSLPRVRYGWGPLWHLMLSVLECICIFKQGVTSVVENVTDRGIFFLSLSSCQYTDEKFYLLQCTEEKAATLPPLVGFSLRDNRGSVYMYEKGDSLLGLCPQLEASLQWIDLPLLLCILEILCLVPLMIRILRYGSRKTVGKNLTSKHKRVWGFTVRP